MSVVRTKLLVVDAMSIVFRHHFAQVKRPLQRPGDGRTVSGLSGLCKTLAKYAKELQPTHVVVCLDSPSSRQGRREIFAEYKATRASPSDDLVWQLRQIADVVAALGIPVVTAPPGWEADDVIADLCHRVEGDRERFAARGDPRWSPIAALTVTQQSQSQSQSQSAAASSAAIAAPTAEAHARFALAAVADCNVFLLASLPPGESALLALPHKADALPACPGAAAAARALAAVSNTAVTASDINDGSKGVALSNQAQSKLSYFAPHNEHDDYDADDDGYGDNADIHGYDDFVDADISMNDTAVAVGTGVSGKERLNFVDDLGFTDDVSTAPPVLATRNTSKTKDATAKSKISKIKLADSEPDHANTATTATATTTATTKPVSPPKAPSPAARAVGSPLAFPFPWPKQWPFVTSPRPFPSPAAAVAARDAAAHGEPSLRAVVPSRPTVAAPDLARLAHGYLLSQQAHGQGETARGRPLTRWEVNAVKGKGLGYANNNKHNTSVPSSSTTTTSAQAANAKVSANASASTCTVGSETPLRNSKLLKQFLGNDAGAAAAAAGAAGAGVTVGRGGKSSGKAGSKTATAVVRGSGAFDDSVDYNNCNSGDSGDAGGGGDFLDIDDCDDSSFFPNSPGAQAHWGASHSHSDNSAILIPPTVSETQIVDSNSGFLNDAADGPVYVPAMGSAPDTYNADRRARVRSAESSSPMRLYFRYLAQDPLTRLDLAIPSQFTLARAARALTANPSIATASAGGSESDCEQRALAVFAAELTAQYAHAHRRGDSASLAAEPASARNAVGYALTLADALAQPPLIDHVYILSYDKDFAQLVSPHTTLLRPGATVAPASATGSGKTGGGLGGGDAVTYLTPALLEREYGVPPRGFELYLSLLGDVSDNVPGVTSCGAVSAAAVARAFAAHPAGPLAAAVVAAGRAVGITVGETEGYLRSVLAAEEKDAAAVGRPWEGKPAAAKTKAKAKTAAKKGKGKASVAFLDEANVASAEADANDATGAGAASGDPPQWADLPAWPAKRAVAAALLTQLRQLVTSRVLVRLAGSGAGGEDIPNPRNFIYRSVHLFYDTIT